MTKKRTLRYFGRLIKLPRTFKVISCGYGGAGPLNFARLGMTHWPPIVVGNGQDRINVDRIGSFDSSRGKIPRPIIEDGELLKQIMQDWRDEMSEKISGEGGMLEQAMQECADNFFPAFKKTLIQNVASRLEEEDLHPNCRCGISEYPFDFHPKCKYCEQDKNGFHEKTCPVSEGHRLLGLGQGLSEENDKLKRLIREALHETQFGGPILCDTFSKLTRAVKE